MTSPPPDVSAPIPGSPDSHSSRHPPRPQPRHRSRQRDRILSWLKQTDSHPTAAEIYQALLPEMSALSLGTVYRNLDVLVACGDVDAVPSSQGATRYDGNTAPHHHFNCEQCGHIIDVEIPVPRGLTRRLANERGLHSSRVHISFFGLCTPCAEAAENPEPAMNNQDTRRKRHG